MTCFHSVPILCQALSEITNDLNVDYIYIYNIPNNQLLTKKRMSAWLIFELLQFLNE